MTARLYTRRNPNPSYSYITQVVYRAADSKHKTTIDIVDTTTLKAIERIIDKAFLTGSTARNIMAIAALWRDNKIESYQLASGFNLATIGIEDGVIKVHWNKKRYQVSLDYSKTKTMPSIT